MEGTNHQEFIINSPEELTSLARTLLDFAGARKKIFLYGEIGAGKTTFTKALCQLLGVKDNVSSPTFSLINQYEYIAEDGETRELMHHLDLYRLQNLQEAIDIGIEDILYDNQLCLIEWPELIETLAPIDTVKINIEILDNSRRKVIFL